MDWSRLNNVDHPNGVTLSETMSEERLRQLNKKFVRLNLLIKIKGLKDYPYSMGHLFTVAFRFFVRNFKNLIDIPALRKT